MPELPEVETTLRGILPYIQQQTIAQVFVRQYALRWPISPAIQQILPGQTVVQAERRAKYILLYTTQGTIIIHLGMSGHLRVLDKNCPPNKHDHLDLVFHNQKMLRFTDPRRFGAFIWAAGEPSAHFLLKSLGAEPLTKLFSGKYLWQKAQGRGVAIKVLLMDNKIVTGIGNIYATEALFEAGIHPQAKASSLSLAQMQRLCQHIKRILRRAIQRGGTTLKDFVNSEGKPGYFSNQLKAYGRAGQPCLLCKRLLQSMKLGQRRTVYCKYCQR